MGQIKPSKLQCFTWLLLALLISFPAAAETVTGRPSRIISGDKLVVTTDTKQYLEVKLLGIQAPPLKSSWGRAAHKRLSGLVAGKPVTVEYNIRNRWGQALGKIKLGDTDINLRLLEAGLVNHKPDFQTLMDNNLYSQAVQKAKSRRLGIWGVTPNPMPLK